MVSRWGIAIIALVLLIAAAIEGGLFDLPKAPQTTVSVTPTPTPQ